jgi:hypothetical protein
MAEGHLEFVQKFCAKEDLNFRLLADSDKKVADAYGSLSNFLAIKVAVRHTVVMDPQGSIARVFAEVKPAAHIQEVLATLDALVPEGGQSQVGRHIARRANGKREPAATTGCLRLRGSDDSRAGCLRAGACRMPSQGCPGPSRPQAGAASPKGRWGRAGIAGTAGPICLRSGFLREEAQPRAA